MQESLGIGFVGGGFITKFHIQSLVGVRNCEVMGVMSRTQSSAEDSIALAKNLGVGTAKLYKNVSEMVADKEIDALWICAPNFTRIEIMEEIVSSIESGKGSLIGIACEKPLGRNVREAKKVLELCQRVNLLDGYLENQVFDLEIFPDMTLSLRMAMIDEARLFFRSIIKENKSVIEFVDSNYTFLNEQLSKLYGITESVIGEDMRRVKLTNPNRGGIIGMPATLASTSFSNRTSPVRRGVWVLEQVLGERVPSPPPDIPELEELDHENEQGLTLRQRTELHQSEATCANCHKLLDPIGFGLENFDAIGRWREVNNEGLRIDSSGQLPNGEKFTSPALLKSLLIKRKGDLARNFTEKFMAHALGRQLEGYDYIVIDQLMDKISADDYRIRTIITEVITSYLFTHRRVEG